MSKLEYYSRPLVAFDAHNKEHRRFYYQFQKTKSWGHCPVRFIVPDGTGMDLIKMIQQELIAYYVDKEFKDEKPMPTYRPKHLGVVAGGYELTM